ncbi:hypothetical protein [Candidatus Palauibacter sp.]|uniref:hypothetical protein n=1 Tax=Candidatus Palauibacter sp. TaxID=3101350 RepID=UPI003D1309CF
MRVILLGLWLVSPASAAPFEAQPTLLDPTISVAIGGIDQELIGVRDMYYAPSGDLVILDRDEVVVLDPEGEIKHVWGRMGGGPGEFTSPIAIAANDSTVFVAERDKVGAFSLDGDFIENLRVGNPTRFVTDVALAGDEPIALVLAVMGQTEVVALADNRTLATVSVTFQPGVIFAALPSIAALDDGRFVVAQGDTYAARVLNFGTAQEVGLISRDVDIRPVTDAFRDKMLRYLENPASAPGGWAAWVGAEPAPSALLSQIRFAETFPAVSKMFQGPADALWVQRGAGVGDDLAESVDPPSGEYTAFDLFDLEDYGYLGVVRLPGDFQPVAANETRLAGVVTSGLAPTLRVFEVSFPP